MWRSSTNSGNISAGANALGQDFWPISTPANIAFIGLRHHELSC